MPFRITILVLLVAAACSGDDGSGSGPDVAADYCESIASSFCDFYLRCDRMDVADTDECRTAFAESCESRFEPRYADLEAAGLLQVSAAGVAACKQHLQSVACDQQVRELSGPCAEMWVGQQPVGEACSYDVEALICEPGSECVLDLSLCGECQPLAAPGEACGVDIGVTCGSAASCVEGVCVARVANGEPCGDEDRCQVGSVCEGGVCTPPQFVGQGQACDQRRRCQYTTACADGTCVKLAALGDSCESDAWCDAGYCDGSVCAPLLEAGDSCERPEQCASAMCEGTCQPLPGDCL